MDSNKHENILHKIDAALAYETTLLEGLTIATQRGWMTAVEAEDCLRAYIEANTI